ncbi:hypothetical protein [Gloeothece verrucosa]|uniref:Specificity determinant for HsdM and HsdR n=1 Tax=Gloeothece verrucosa (strain PCC 7822) TaxID=497965 RepID=E0UDW4_GLOV7|nr:hypothetical protein [Gloeothece verrucosa]ADN16549.1 specificity determinant for HsdM and HsdR [Gloeothece verrucosa PCC 7822]
MPIPSEITELIDRLNQELSQIEQDASEGVSLIRLLLSQFSDNVRLIQFLAFFNNGLFLVEISRRRIQGIYEKIAVPDVTEQEIQNAGEELGTLLGQILETQIRGRRILNILDEIR